MYVVIRAARTAPDRRMSCAIVARAPRTFRDAAWTLRLVYRRRYSHIEGRRLLAGLGSVAALGLWGRCCLPAQGHYRRSPSRLGSRRRRPRNRRLYSGSRNRHHRTSRPGAAAIAATDRGSTAARAIGQPSPSHAPSLMNRDGAWKTEP
jgi:hypothetical protein